MTRIKILLLIAGIFLFNNCSVTRITSTWKAPDSSVTDINKIMVLGIIREADRNLRIQMENHLVNDLEKLGYSVASSYKQYGPKMFQDMTEQQANEKLRTDGIDAVITVVLLDKQKERYYVPARPIYSPYGPYHDQFWSYYNSLSIRIEGGGYYQVRTKYFWESNFYDLKENKLLYSVQTQSFDSKSTYNLAHEYGQKIINSMLKNNVLQKQNEKVVKAM
jgi:hypothetical protein